MLNFKTIIDQLSQNNTYLTSISEANQRYAIKHLNLSKLTPTKVIQLHQVNQSKLYKHYLINPHDHIWLENQLKIFIWILAGYCFLTKKTIQQLNNDDWIIFSDIFPYRSKDLFLFESQLVIRTQNKLIKWCQQQIQMFLQITNEKGEKRKWNDIGRQLFFKSGKKYLRSGKQCRQRWINHHDPIKIHSQWNKTQDKILLTYILKYGKKWSNISKALANKRTQHMVKNRYKSLYVLQCKKHSNRTENQIICSILQKISNNIELKQKKVKSIKKSVQCEYKFQMIDDLNDLSEQKLSQDYFPKPQVFCLNQMKQEQYMQDLKNQMVRNQKLWEDFEISHSLDFEKIIEPQNNIFFDDRQQDKHQTTFE